MINFFRKIRQQQLTENKFSKYLLYGVGEIILVVIGILIALQINNWNENIQAGKQEIILLKNLKLEMEENEQLLNDYIHYKEIRVQTFDLLLTYTNPEYTKKEEDSLDTKLHRIFTVDNFKPNMMVLEAAKNTNAIDLIRHQKIKTGLAKWEQTLKILAIEDMFGNEQYNNSLVPIVSKFYTLRNINSVAKSKHASELEAMFRNRLFENSAFRMRIFHLRAMTVAKELKVQTSEMIDLLQAELPLE